MDVLQMLTINDVSYPVNNTSDYYLDEYLDSDYGFELFYRRSRGMAEVRWDTLLNRDGFRNPLKWASESYHSVETHNTQLNFREYITKPHVFHWVTTGQWYALAFDGQEFMVQNNHGNLWLPDRVL